MIFFIILSMTINATALPVKSLCITFYDPNKLSPLTYARPSTQALMNRLIVLNLGRVFSVRGDENQVDLLNKIEDLRPFIEDFLKSWHKMSLEQRKSELELILQSIKVYRELDQFFNMQLYLGQKAYSPIEAYVEREIFNRLVTYMRLLPNELRFKIFRPTYDLTLKNNTKMGALLVDNLEQRIEQEFYQTEGIPYKEFVRRMKGSLDVRIKQAISIIDSNQINFVMYRTEGRRNDISVSGFINQFITKTSGGSLLPDMRNSTEASMLNVPLKDYETYSAHLKPKYGTFRVSEVSGLSNNTTGASRYGADIFVFKTEEIKDRLTFYIDDSLGRQTGIGNLNGQPDWTKFMIPWRFRYLMIPFMLDGLSKSKFDIPTIKLSDLPAEINLNLLRGLEKEKSLINLVGDQVNTFQGAYWETQYFGILTLKHVKEFIFTDNPPSGKFLIELRRHGVIITDGRGQLPKPWDEFDTTKPPKKENEFNFFGSVGLPVLSTSPFGGTSGIFPISPIPPEITK
ncbi:MAG: hypothetical protein HUU56_07325 [Bdellovibrionaceae bacterium]|nr:hypothetical protein [Pseudobdellovibrionaceae bacterium]